ncbi:MAG: 1-(5-phosphoribosyl)-5-[(5-phosphoribosylamino)methylideneamino]imidazole-4-carboxamide isomerase [Promethearchaeota archaeon]|jgi:phosphoribosylformimino-5-aminoimidazole carboxamide ribotide isomerase
MVQIIPAVDILESQLVRLTRGDPDTKRHYHTRNPFEAAIEWAHRGAEMIHIIDLDAALGSTPNTDMILEIVQEIDIPIQVGGGIRKIKMAQKLLNGGVMRIILGSMPIKELKKSLKLLDEYGPERIVIALDHVKGYLHVKGWQESTNIKLIDSLKGFTEKGYEYFLVTNIDHDGTLRGPDISTYSVISTMAKIIASGGVSSTNDLMKLKEADVEAVVIGKALYENKLTLEDAMEVSRY